MSIALGDFRSVYFIGIKGVAMAGLAVICKQRGLDVRGSDVAEKFITDQTLADHGIVVLEEFAAENLAYRPELIVVGASWDAQHPEVRAARSSGAVVISDSELRGMLSREKRTVAVTGVHGKTTTTALLAYLFFRSGLRPSFLVGTGTVPDLNGNAAWHDGKHFIVEGDEYVRAHHDPVPKFLDLESTITVITNVEWEHVDIYKDEQAIIEAFSKLAGQTKEVVVACADWPGVQQAVQSANCAVVTYGREAHNQWRADNIHAEYDRTVFDVLQDGEKIGQLATQLHGEHNVLNALACAIVALHEGISFGQLQQFLPEFRGAQRRFDVSERQGVIFVDDYAHHPTAIRATLKAIRHRFPDKTLWCVFQPHMASRTRALLEQFATAFSDADHVVVADIFASAREQSEAINSEILAGQIQQHHPSVAWPGDLNEVLNFLQDKIQPGAVLITMGAGDVYRVRDKFLERLSG